MISLQSSGSFKKTEGFLSRLSKTDIKTVLSKHGQEGVAALQEATPKDSGLAASSWSYKVIKNPSGWELCWINSDVENGGKVVLLIQYGHGTNGGNYVEGRDFINPAIKPIFERIKQDVWKAVNTA